MNTTALALQSDRPSNRSKNNGDPYLKFQLDAHTSALFSMRTVQEAVILPANRLTPMPNVQVCMLGLMNRRSRVLWVIDLPQLMGLPPLDTSVRQYNIIIIRIGSLPLGLAVQRVKGITWVVPGLIQPPIKQASPQLLPYLEGSVLQDDEITLVLDAEAIAHSSQIRNF